MKASTLLKTGIIGTLLAALCCATPLLAGILAMMGLAAWNAHLDAVLIPVLIFFVTLTVYAFNREQKEHTHD